MTLKLILRHLRSKAGQTFLTALATALSVFAFVVLRSVSDAWSHTPPSGAEGRLVTRHALSLLIQWPIRYAQQVRNMPIVDSATEMLWVGMQSPSNRENTISFNAVDPEQTLRMYGSQITLSNGAAEAWKANRDGLLCGDAILASEHWKVGDQLSLLSGLFPSPTGSWSFHISGSYRSTAIETDRCYMHYSYVNDSLPPERQNLMLGMFVRLKDGVSTADGSRQIDARLRELGMTTRTEDTYQTSKTMYGMIGSIMGLLDLLCLILVGTVMFLVVTAISLSIRERTREFGILRAIGFGGFFVARLIVLESVVLALIGGVVGFGLGAALVQAVLKPALAASSATMFPTFGINARVTALTLGGVAIAGLVAGIPIALSVLRTRTIDAVRFIG